MKVRKNKLNESINDWKEVDSKEVFDSDNFITDYTWYTNGDKHIFMFGDKDITEPDEDYADWECDSEEEAQEWFDDYDEHYDSAWLADYDKEDEYYFEGIKNKRKLFKKGANENMKIRNRKNESINLMKAKRLLENNGYIVNKKLRESENDDGNREEMKKYLSKLLFNASVVIGDVYDGIEKIVNTKVYPDFRDVSLSDSEKKILRDTQMKIYKIGNYIDDEDEYYTFKF